MGYKKSSTEVSTRVVISCAHDDCQFPAMARIKVKTGWAFLCRKHYDFHYQQEANLFCVQSGLDTFEKKRAYCKDKAKLFGHLGKLRFRQVMERVPGEDDEDIAA